MGADYGGGGSSAEPLPQDLQKGIEELAGISLDGVRVYRDSAEPAKVGALSFTSNNAIHLGPGQEKNLAHEAWHVVQQRQGRVSAAATLKTGPGITNDDPGLEKEAENMGGRFASACN